MDVGAFQSPQTAKGGDSPIFGLSNWISIPAPARERPAIEINSFPSFVFHSSPPQGSDPARGLSPLIRAYFNLRSREGSDCELFDTLAQLILFQSPLP